jgi:hypothetical protein
MGDGTREGTRKTDGHRPAPSPTGGHPGTDVIRLREEAKEKEVLNRAGYSVRPTSGGRKLLSDLRTVRAKPSSQLGQQPTSIGTIDKQLRLASFLYVQQVVRELGKSLVCSLAGLTVAKTTRRA